MNRSLDEMIALRAAVAEKLGNDDPDVTNATTVLNAVDRRFKTGPLLEGYYHSATRNRVRVLLADLDARIAAVQHSAPDNPTASDTEVIDPQDIEEVLEPVPPTDEEMPVYAPVENGKRRLSRSGWFGFGE